MLQAGPLRCPSAGPKVVTPDAKRAQAQALKEEGNDLAKMNDKSEA